MSKTALSWTKRNSTFFLLFLFSFALCLIFTNEYDDMFFASINDSTISTAFNNSVKYGNARYLGNFICFLIINSTITKCFIKAFTLTACTFLVQKCFGTKSKSITLLSCCLFVLSSPRMIAEVFNWTAGFINYFVPLLLFLLSIYIIQNLTSFKTSVSKTFMTVVLVVLQFSCQLFSENTAVFIFVFTLILLINSFIKKTNRIPLTLSFVANTCGLIIVLFGTRIFKVAQTILPASGKRDLIDTVFSKEIFTNAIKFSVVFESTINSSIVIITILSLSLFALLSISNPQIKSEKFIKLMKMYILLYPIVSVISLLLLFSPITSTVIRFAVSMIKFGLLLVYAVFIVVSVCISVKSKKEKRELIFWLFMAAISALPLIIVSPVSARCFFLTLSLMIVFIVKLISLYKSKIIEFYGIEKHKKTIFLAAKTSMVAVFITLFVVYADVYFVANARDEYVKQQMKSGVTEIVVPRLPFEQFLANPNENSGTYAALYFYEKHQDITFDVRDTRDWFYDYYYPKNDDSTFSSLFKFMRVIDNRNIDK